MQEILQNDIKISVRNRLFEKFPNAKYYIDGEIKSYPAIYISFYDIDMENIGLRAYEYYRMSFSMRVEYRESSDPTSIANLNTILDNAGHAMMDVLRYINLYGTKRYTTYLRNETVDNIRIVDFYFTLTGTFEKLQEEKMRYIEIQEKLKEEKR